MSECVCVCDLQLWRSDGVGGVVGGARHTQHVHLLVDGLQRHGDGDGDGGGDSDGGGD